MKLPEHLAKRRDILCALHREVTNTVSAHPLIDSIWRSKQKIAYEYGFQACYEEQSKSCFLALVEAIEDRPPQPGENMKSVERYVLNIQMALENFKRGNDGKEEKEKGKQGST